MARVAFVDNLWDAADELFPPTLGQNGPRVKSAKIGQALKRSGSWLIPKAVEGFEPKDFVELPPHEQEALRQASAGFLAVTGAVPPGRAGHEEQVQEALPHFLRLVELVSQAEVAAWRQAVDQFLAEAEEWSREQHWGVKRDNKRLTEKYLGTYEVPRLLIHTLENQRYFLDPLARQVCGASGRVDLCVVPSYDSVPIVRTATGWYLLLDRGPAAQAAVVAENVLTHARPAGQGGMNKRQVWFERIKAVEQEFLAATAALALLANVIRSGGRLPRERFGPAQEYLGP